MEADVVVSIIGSGATLAVGTFTAWMALGISRKQTNADLRKTYAEFLRDKKGNLEAAKKEIDGLMINVQDVGPGNQHLIFARSLDAFLIMVNILSTVEHYLKPDPVAEIRAYSDRLSEYIEVTKRMGKEPTSPQVKTDVDNLHQMKARLKSILVDELRQTIRQIEVASGAVAWQKGR